MRQRHSAAFRRVVDQDEYLLARTDPAADLYAFGHCSEHWRDIRLLRHPFGGCRHQLVVQHSADVGDPALSAGASDDGRLVVEPSVAPAILQKNFVPASLTLQLLSPDAGFSAPQGTGNRD